MAGGISLLFASLVWAQDGPELPCENCPDFHELMQYPASGIWFNPEQSGTGFMLDVQDGIVAGYYLIYTEAGDPEWLMFTDRLEVNEDEESNARWILETDLLRVSGGACLNCPYRPFDQVESVATLRMEFPWRSHGRFSIDQGSTQNIVPLSYSLPGRQLFEPFSDYQFPSLTGLRTLPPFLGWLPSSGWVLLLSAPAGIGWDYAMLPAGLGDSWEANGDGSLSVRFGATIAGEFGYDWGTVTCWAETDSGPMCRIDFDLALTSAYGIPDFFVSKPFYLAPGNIGHDRIEALSEGGGVSLTGFRVNFD